MMRRRLVSIALAAILSGCGQYEVRSLYYLMDVETADLVIDEQTVARVPLESVKGPMVRATWKSGRALNKGNLHLRLESRPDIFVSYYGDFFWVENQPGYFVIIDQDRIEFKRFFSELPEIQIIPRRERRNSEPERPVEPSCAAAPEGR